MQEFVIGGGLEGQSKIRLDMANRHGVIAGATGTGKTVTLQVLAEAFSKAGVPVFLADVKGDLSGLAQAAKSHPKIDERIQKIKLNSYSPNGFPTLFWDLLGKDGHSVRTTISEMGPLLLSQMLRCNEVQEGVLYGTFKCADEQGLLLLDLKDLQSLLSWMLENRKELSSLYGNITSSTVGALQRRLLVLEEQGADHFFGEPALQLKDLQHTDFSGRGVISILQASNIFATSPKLYAAFLLWLMAELFEQMPECGDQDRPKMIFFFDEAHLLFDGASSAVLEKVEQVVRLIRSKGVGIYFVTQNPTDIPEAILGQCGLKIQHALRAFTPKDRKAIKAAAENFRTNPNIDVATALTDLGIGEALISKLDQKGRPTMVDRVLICPPESQIGPIDDATQKSLVQKSPLAGTYDQVVDRESAYEMLAKQAQQSQVEEARIREAEERQEKEEKERAYRRRRPEKKVTTRRRRSNRQSVGEAFMKSAARSIGNQMGRKLFRGLLGSLLK